MSKAFLYDFNHLTGRESHLLSERTIVGRGSVDKGRVDSLRIEWCTISRRHALIEYRDNQYWLSDQNSRNGTFVNGVRIKGKVCLRHGDRIRFDQVEFYFFQQEMGGDAQPVTNTKGVPTYKGGPTINGRNKFSPALAFVPYPAI